MERTGTLEQFEQLVLTAVATLDDAYGVTIHDMVEQLSGRQLQFGPIYSTLNRLENKGYVSSKTVKDPARRGGRPRRNYKIRRTGMDALKESALTADRVRGALQNRYGEQLWAGEHTG